MSYAQYGYDLRSATLIRRNPTDQHYQLNNIQLPGFDEFSLKCYKISRASELENMERRWTRLYERRKKAQMTSKLNLPSFVQRIYIPPA